MALKLFSKPSDCIIYQVIPANDVVQGSVALHSDKSGYAFAIEGGKAGTEVAYCLEAPYAEAVVQAGQSIAPGDDVFVKLDGSGLARNTTDNGYSATKVGYCINSYGTTSNAGEKVTVRWASTRETG